MTHPPRDPELQRDAAAAVAARRELGPEYDEHIAAGLAERVEGLVAARMADTRLDARHSQAEIEAEKSSRTQRFVIGIVSLGAGIPVTAITIGNEQPLGLAVAWAGIVGVNVAHALGARRRRD